MGWMEEESTEDREYYLTAEDCDLMEEQGIDPTLIEVLREALQGPRGYGHSLRSE